MESKSGIVRAVCTSGVKGVQKKNVGSAVFRADWGIVGDAHAGDWPRQVSLISHERVAQFRGAKMDIPPGAFGENLVVDGLDFGALPIGTRLRCGDVLLVLTQIGKVCHSRCRIYEEMGDCIMPREGVFAKVLRGGSISAGDRMAVLDHITPSPFRAAVLTLSDKGAAGERADESGALVWALLEAAGYEISEQLLLPDDRLEIERALKRLADQRQVALILTTGGTGFSPRDVTPEATMAVAQRSAPGIAEAMRRHSMTITKRAMLSRGVSVIRGGTLIVNLPGSPKAAGECLEYILPELAHGIAVLRGLAGECAGG